MSDIDKKIRDSFARQGLMKTLGASIKSVAPGHVVVSLPLGPAVTQQHGFAHGGAIAALGDTACGYAALSLMPEGKAVLTSEFKINLMAPAVGPFFEAEGRVLRAGKRAHVVQGDIYSLDGKSRKHVAVMLATMMVIDADQGIKD